MEILYGVKSEDVDAVAEAVEAALGVQLQPRESSFLGEYWRGRVDGVKLTVQGAREPEPEGELHEPAFAGYGVLVYAEGPSAVPGVAGLQTPVGVVELLREN